MTKSKSATELEKTRRQWKEHIRSWKQSGITQAAYCQKFNLIKHRFTYWKLKLDKNPDFALIPVNIMTQTINHQVDRPMGLFIGSKYKINILDDFNPVTLKKVLHVLEGI